MSRKLELLESFVRRVVTDPVYLAQVRRRYLDGTLDPGVEAMMRECMRSDPEQWSVLLGILGPEQVQ